MNKKIIVIMVLSVVVLGFMKYRSASKKAAVVKAREQAKIELQKLEKKHEKAKKIIKRKLAEGAKWDSRFDGYGQDVDQEALKQNKGKVTGRVDIWGVKRGSTFGSSDGPEGIVVEITKEDDFSSYSARVDSKHRYTISAPAGKYTLKIDDPEYKPYQAKLTIRPGQANVQNMWVQPAP
jgi:hypothetical protein